MQLSAIALAASLVFGPAPVESAEPAIATPLPDVDDPDDPDDPPDADPIAEGLPDVEPSEADVEPSEADVAPEPAPEAPPPTLEPEPEPAPLPAPAVRDKLGCDGNRSCRRMTVAGIVVGTLGLAAVGTGIGLRVKQDEVIPKTPTFVSSTRPAGVVTLTIGAGVTLTAVLMLIAAHRGHKQSARRPAKPEQARRIAPIPNGLRF